MSTNEEAREGTAVCDVDFPFRVCSVSETGPVREKNEDKMVHFDSPFGHVVMVADGMGGHASGEIASKMGQQGTSSGVPTFAAIARMPSTTQMSLSVFLQTPHAGMPDLHLSRDEIADLATYILSLRRQE